MISIKNISKKYGGDTVVDSVSLDVRNGIIFGFMGQNGSGKTTTMKMIVGITSPTSGTVEIDGVPLGDMSVHEKIGYMPEAPYFYDRLTGLEFLRFSGELFRAGKKSDSKYDELLKKVGLYDARDKAIQMYSKGMKQRLGFAQALVNDPRYVFLDEPLDGLDPIGRREIKEMIKSLKASGTTVFFNSHILYDTEELCDEIGIIDKGALLYCGPVKEFCANGRLEEKFIALVEKNTTE